MVDYIIYIIHIYIKYEHSENMCRDIDIVKLMAEYLIEKVY